MRLDQTWSTDCMIHSMQTQNLILNEFGKNPLTMGNMQHPMLREMDNDHSKLVQTVHMDQTDPRWQFAARVQMTLGRHHRVQSIGQYEALVEAASQSNISGIHARSMIAMVEDAQSRGGLDYLVMEELLSIPLPNETPSSLPERLNWMTFGVLFLWAFVIAGMMQFV